MNRLLAEDGDVTGGLTPVPLSLREWGDERLGSGLKTRKPESITLPGFRFA